MYKKNYRENYYKNRNYNNYENKSNGVLRLISILLVAIFGFFCFSSFKSCNLKSSGNVIPTLEEYIETNKKTRQEIISVFKKIYDEDIPDTDLISPEDIEYYDTIENEIADIEEEIQVKTNNLNSLEIAYNEILINIYGIQSGLALQYVLNDSENYVEEPNRVYNTGLFGEDADTLLQQRYADACTGSESIIVNQLIPIQQQIADLYSEILGLNSSLVVKKQELHNLLYKIYVNAVMTEIGDYLFVRFVPNGDLYKPGTGLVPNSFRNYDTHDLNKYYIIFKMSKTTLPDDITKITRFDLEYNGLFVVSRKSTWDMLLINEHRYVIYDVINNKSIISDGIRHVIGKLFIGSPEYNMNDLTDKQLNETLNQALINELCFIYSGNVNNYVPGSQDIRTYKVFNDEMTKNTSNFILGLKDIIPTDIDSEDNFNVNMNVFTDMVKEIYLNMHYDVVHYQVDIEEPRLNVDSEYICPTNFGTPLACMINEYLHKYDGYVVSYSDYISYLDRLNEYNLEYGISNRFAYYQQKESALKSDSYNFNNLEKISNFYIFRSEWPDNESNITLFKAQVNLTVNYQKVDSVGLFDDIHTLTDYGYNQSNIAELLKWGE